MQVIQSQFTTQHPMLSPTAIAKYMRCPLQFYYGYVADIQQPDVPDDEQELDNRIFGNVFHEAAEIIYRQLPREIDKPLLDHLLKSKVEIERAVDEAFHKVMPFATKSGLHLINREVIIHYLRQLITIDRRLAPFTILGLERDVKRPLSQFQVSSFMFQVPLAAASTGWTSSTTSTSAWSITRRAANA
jgi:ATP-dependent helicase/DNAse subunit B